MDVTPTIPGSPFPLGATRQEGGTNFAVASGTADGILLCLFDSSGAETQIPLKEVDAGVWHAFVPGVGPGQAYGYRATGPYDPGRGIRCHPAKLLTDPYALAITGRARYGPEVLGYSLDDPEQPSQLDSADHVPRSVVVDPGFKWSDRPRPGYSYADSVVYEVHVKGFTMTHPDVPAELRGTYAGLAHEAPISHLVDLGVTSVELLPVHHSVPEQFLLDRGLTNYWGYNTIGFFAPHETYSAAGRAGRPGGQVAEFKAMVDALHGAGLEVILDVVFNHTAEGNHMGPTLCFRGLDNSAYYRLAQDPRLLHRRHRLWQHRQCRRPPVAQAHHGLAALLVDGNACRWVPLRPGPQPGPAGGRLRPGGCLFRHRVPGSVGLPGQAGSRAMGRRPDRQLRARAVPAAVERVER